MNQITINENAGITLAGIVEYVLRDAVTGEVVERKTKKNQLRVTGFHGWILPAADIYADGPAITLVTQSLRKGVRQFDTPNSANSSRLTTAVVGVPRLSKMVMGDGTLAIQFAARNNPPAADMSWKGVVLGLSKYSAGTNFDTPCTQTTTLVLDVYYRILFKPAAANGLSSGRINRLIDIIIASVKYNTPYSDTYSFGAANIDRARYAHVGMFPLPKYKPEDVAEGLFGGPMTPDIVGTNQTFNPNTVSFDLSSGRYFRCTTRKIANFSEVVAWRSFTKNQSTIQDGEFAVTRTVYNTFSQRVPTDEMDWSLQNVDNMATGAGAAKFSGNWADTVINADGTFTEGVWPKVVKAAIATSGKSSDGSGTYTMKEYPLIDNNLPLNIPITAKADIVQLFPRLITNPYNLGARCIKPYSKTSLLLNDAKMVMVYVIPTGQYFRYTHPDWTDIRAVEASPIDGSIYIADGIKGLYKVNPKVANSQPTKIVDATNTVDLTSAFAVSVGKDNNVWVVGNNGIGKLTASTGTWSVYNETSTSPISLVGLGNLSSWNEVLGLGASTTVDGDLAIVTTTTNKLYKYNPATTPLTSMYLSTTASYVRSIQDGFFQYLTPSGGSGQSRITKFTDTAETAGIIYSNELYMYDRGIRLQERPDPSTGYSAFRARNLEDTAYLSYKTLRNWYPNTSLYLYMGDGVIINIRFDTSSGAVPYENSGFIYIQTWPLVPIGPDATAVNTVSWGWNGSSWVKGLTTGKPLHQTEQDTPWAGVKIKFTDSATNPTATQFAATETYSSILYQGVLSDNATRTEFRMTTYINLAQQVAGTAVVPAAVTNTGVLNPITTLDDEIYDSGGGVYKTRNDIGSLQLVFRNKPLIGSNWAYTVDTTGCATGDINRFYLGVTSSTLGDSNVELYSRNDSAKNPISVTYNGSNTKWNNTLKALTASASIPVFQLPMEPLAGALPTISITANGSACLVPIGSQADNTGTYRDTFDTVDALSPENWVKLDGVQIPIRFDTTAPAPGECAIPFLSGVIILNPADAGKSVSYNLRCVYME